MSYFYISIALAILVVLMTARLISYYIQNRKLKKHYRLTENQLLQEVEKEKNLQGQMMDLQSKLSENALIDPLTHLPSRGVFEDRLSLIINQSERSQSMCTVMFLDIDGFKMINDALGYDAGDELLKEISKRLTECIRKVDTVSHIAGDEFVFILPQIAKPEAAALVAQRLLDGISQPFRVQGNDLYLTASIGITFYPADGDNVKALLGNADNALHYAKSRGRNNFQFYREDLHALSRREMVLRASLRSETVLNDFEIYYQPQVNIELKKIICMAATIHWRHADFGLLRLDDFIRIAENCGKMPVISEWMLRTVAGHFKEWHKHGFIPRAIAIPLSLKQLENSRFVQTVTHILQKLDMDPECIVFEISETSFTVKLEQVEKMLHMLRHLGVRIAINFGAGMLPLHSLRRLPANIFKVDRELVQDITVNKESVSIVKMIIALGKSLQIDVIAEGVESAKQKQILVELGCNLVQGDIFGAPGVANEFMNKVVEGIQEK